MNANLSERPPQGTPRRRNRWERVKLAFALTLAIIGPALLIGVLVKVDRAVFREKYPNASTGAYVWHKLSGGH